MIVFWSCDPESTNGAYAGFEGTQRRLWAKELGIEFVHIDPHCNPTAQLLGGRWIPDPPADRRRARQRDHVCLGHAKASTTRITSPPARPASTSGRPTCWAKPMASPRRPNGRRRRPAFRPRTCARCARKWGSKKTYLAVGMTGAGFGGAGRGATGAQWARCMVMMMAMQGWGKPGVNFGALQIGAPHDLHFYFPGYADGGISGELNVDRQRA